MPKNYRWNACFTIFIGKRWEFGEEKEKHASLDAYLRGRNALCASPPPAPEDELPAK